MKKIFTSAFYLCVIFFFNQAFAQQVSTSISTWKNNAKGAYTLIHDDYGASNVDGIWQYADTIASNRGIKFTFGAISGSCEETRWVDGKEYKPYRKAQEMMDRGHEIISHSHTHTCAVYNEWCRDKGWAEFGQEDFETEIDGCTESIESGTGVRPRYFIFPYDLHNQSANARLKQQGYIGSRTGWGDTMAFWGYDRSDANTFRPDVDGFFRTAVQVFDDNDAGLSDNQQTKVLNDEVNNAINRSEWANRELHNVGNEGWGHVTVKAYRDHLDYVKQKKESGDLWVGTVSEILTYQAQKLYYQPSGILEKNNGQIVVRWNTPSINFTEYLNPLNVKTSITLNVDVSQLGLVTEIIQGGKKITDYYTSGDQLSVNIYPHLGPVFIKNQQAVSCPEVCIVQQPQGKVIDDSQSYTFMVSAYSDEQSALTYQWYKGNQAIEGANLASYTVTNATQEASGFYKVVVIAGPYTKTSSVVELYVNEPLVTDQQPYSGTPISIPGKIEAEDFDKGGQDVGYSEDDKSWDPTNNPYRNDGSTVDIGLENGIYSVGWINPGEWLEYTVNIQEDGLYDFTFRTSSDYTQFTWIAPNVTVSVDDKTVISSENLPDTKSWSIYTDTQFKDIQLSKGRHVIRVTFNEGQLGFDYLNISSENVVEPSIDFTANKTNLTTCGEVTYQITTGNQFSNYEWDFGVGANPREASGFGPHKVSYSSQGRKTVSVIADQAYAETKTDFVNVTAQQLENPSLTIGVNKASICEGESVSFFIDAQENQGSSPIYTWYVDEKEVIKGEVFTTSTLKNGESVKCVLLSNESCLQTAEVNSNSLSVNVSSKVSPSIVVEANESAVCKGEETSFNVIKLVNEGLSPQLIWKVNGQSLGLGENFSSKTLNDGDVVVCQLISNASCLSENTVNSNTISVNVLDVVVPTVQIDLTNGTSFPSCKNEFISFKANVSNTKGYPFSYEWFVDGQSKGDEQVFSSNRLTNGSVVFCSVQLLQQECVSQPVESNSIVSGIEVCTSNEIMNLENGSIIFPNPVEEILTIKQDSFISYDILDARGKYLSSSSETSLDVSSFAPGIYLLKLETFDGVVIKSFIKK